MEGRIGRADKYPGIKVTSLAFLSEGNRFAAKIDYPNQRAFAPAAGVIPWAHWVAVVALHYRVASTRLKFANRQSGFVQLSLGRQLRRS